MPKTKNNPRIFIGMRLPVPTLEVMDRWAQFYGGRSNVVMVAVAMLDTWWAMSGVPPIDQELKPNEIMAKLESLGPTKQHDNKTLFEGWERALEEHNQPYIVTGTDEKLEIKKRDLPPVNTDEP